MRWLVLLALLLATARAADWDASNFPNPTAGQFKQCKMMSTANICDPDGVLGEQARYRLDHDLKMLESRTRQDAAKTFCEKKGVTAAMAVVQRVRGGTEEAVKMLANELKRAWNLDPQCQKAVVIVVSIDDRKFWVARDDKVPVYANEFTQIFEQQKPLFQQKNYQQALTNIMQGTWEKALSKQGTPSYTGGGTGGRGQRPPSDSGPGTFGKGDTGGSSGFKFPSISKFVWIILIIGLLMLLFCCCCLCCCCKMCSRGGSNQRVPTEEGGGGYHPGAAVGGGGGGGGGGGAFGNIMRTAAGTGIGSYLGNMLSRRGGGGSAPVPAGNQGYGMRGTSDYQGGGSYPDGPQPVYDDNRGEGGKGLYPSKAIKDEGGGGGW